MDQVSVASGVTQDSKNIALLVWIGSIFFGFIPSLVVYLVKNDDEFVQTHSKEALNWAITATFGFIAAWILTLILIGFLVMVALGICNLIFCILGALAAYKGNEYRLPFAIRLIK